MYYILQPMFGICVCIILFSILSYSILLYIRTIKLKELVLEICKRKRLEKKRLKECDKIVWSIIVDTLNILLFILVLKFSRSITSIPEAPIDSILEVSFALVECIKDKYYLFKEYLIWIILSKCLCIIDRERHFLLFTILFCFKDENRTNLKRGILCKILSFSVLICTRSILKEEEYLFIRSIFMINQKESINMPYIYSGCIAAQSVYLKNIIIELL